MLKDAKTFSSFSVNDLAAAKEFYSQTLGIDVIDDDMGLKLQFADNNVLFIYQKDDHVPATFTVLNFQVDNIDQTTDELIANGVNLERYTNLPAPQDEKGILRGLAANMGPDIAWFKDPAGNVIAVLQDT